MITLVAPAIADPQHAAHDALADVLRGRIARGARVVITAGSRGIANLPLLLRGLANAVRDVGGADARVARIKSTLHIDSMIVSYPALATTRNNGRYAITGESDALALRASDHFAPFPTEI